MNKLDESSVMWLQKWAGLLKEGQGRLIFSPDMMEGGVKWEETFDKHPPLSRSRGFSYAAKAEFKLSIGNPHDSFEGVMKFNLYIEEMETGSTPGMLELDMVSINSNNSVYMVIEDIDTDVNFESFSYSGDPDADDGAQIESISFFGDPLSSANVTDFRNELNHSDEDVKSFSLSMIRHALKSI